MDAEKVSTLLLSFSLLAGCSDSGGSTSTGASGASSAGTDSASATGSSASDTAASMSGTSAGSASDSNGGSGSGGTDGSGATDSTTATATATGSSTSATASGSTSGGTSTSGTGASGTVGTGTASAGSTGGVTASTTSGTGGVTAGGSTSGGTQTTGAVTTTGNMFPCDKVDFLFVIDNSLSMEDEQANLIASFQGFIDEIEMELPVGTDYQIGVTSTDAYSATPNPCKVDGALITTTTTQACGPYAAGGTFMTNADDLVSKFTCAADIGINGSGNERPMDTLRASIGPVLNAAGGCNDGFLRDDALLVVIIVTDEEDDHEVMACNWPAQTGSAGDPIDWFNDVVAIKGLESRAVVLSLVGPSGGQACPALDKCGAAIVGAEEATRILAFTDMFSYGIVGQVCAANYGPFFSQAVGVIKTACEVFPA